MGRGTRGVHGLCNHGVFLTLMITMIEGAYRAEHDLGMSVELAGPSSVQTIPQEEGMLRLWMRISRPLQPLLRSVQKLPELLPAELQGVMVLEQHQPMAGLTVLEKIGGCHHMLRLHSALQYVGMMSAFMTCFDMLVRILKKTVQHE